MFRLTAAIQHTVSYAVTASDYSELTPVIMPQSNKSVQFNIEINGVSEPMVFQLFDNLTNTAADIEALVKSGFYNGLEIYRNATGFVLQGGNDPPTGAIKANQPNIPEEFNPDLQFTTAGLLAMANEGAPNTSSTGILRH